MCSTGRWTGGRPRGAPWRQTRFDVLDCVFICCAVFPLWFAIATRRTCAYLSKPCFRPCSSSSASSAATRLQSVLLFVHRNPCVPSVASAFVVFWKFLRTPDCLDGAVRQALFCSSNKKTESVLFVQAKLFFPLGVRWRQLVRLKNYRMEPTLYRMETTMYRMEPNFYRVKPNMYPLKPNGSSLQWCSSRSLPLLTPARTILSLQSMKVGKLVL